MWRHRPQAFGITARSAAAPSRRHLAIEWLLFAHLRVALSVALAGRSKEQNQDQQSNDPPRFKSRDSLLAMNCARQNAACSEMSKGRCPVASVSMFSLAASWVQIAYRCGS